MKNFNKSTVDLRYLISIAPNGNASLQWEFINEKFIQNITPLLGNSDLINSPQTSMVNKEIERFYHDFYNALTLRELLYLYKNHENFKTFDQIFFHVVLKENYLENASFEERRIFEVALNSINVVEKYDGSIPLEWFIEINSQELNDLFNTLRIKENTKEKITK